MLPAGCLWTALRPVEGFKYDETIEELKTIYPPGPGEDVEMDQDDPSYCILPESVPAPIREMAEDKLAIESLGTMIWYLRQLNIDKDILTMKNFNVYDPMKRGMGLTLDGQTLSHLEVKMRLILPFTLLTSTFIYIGSAQQWRNRRGIVTQTSWAVHHTFWQAALQNLALYALARGLRY